MVEPSRSWPEPPLRVRATRPDRWEARSYGRQPRRRSRTQRRCSIGPNASCDGSRFAPAADSSSSCSSGLTGVTPRAWAVESAGGMGYLLAQQLVAAGETVLDVPATLASRVGVQSTGQSAKTDANDARSVAVAALRSPSLATVRPADHVTVCRLLAKHHTDPARWRNKLCCRLHALVAELVPGGIDKEVVINQARSLLDGVVADDAAAAERHRQAVELVDELDHLDVVLKDSRARMITAVAASGTTVKEIFGVGPIVARMLIGYSGDPTRFTTAATPPVPAPPRSSSPPEAGSPTVCPAAGTAGSTTRCTSPRSPRSATATALAAITTTASAPRDTPAREAIRALKRRLSDVVWRHLVADAQRVATR
jgi:transposase